MDHSLLNGHPKFFGYITSSPAPIGALADLLAATVNPNVGANILSPMATAIEKQTIKWLAEFIGVSPTYGGILVSGGNLANFTAFLAARTAKAPKNLKEDGLVNTHGEMVLYCSKATHTWVEKAAVLFGHGSKAIRWIPTRADNTMNTEILSQTIEEDLTSGKRPFMVIGNAGDVSTGVVDTLSAIATICKANDLWFHVDGAYGIPAAVIPQYKKLFEGIQEADSIALDPHKWLYAPLEAGCTLIKNPQHLIDTYSSHPVYYNFSNTEDEPSTNFYEYGFQNSRGFRALKVWMALQQVGKTGYIKMIGQDIALSQLLFEEAKKHPELEAVTQNLSITTLRYIPVGSTNDEKYLNSLNERLLNELQQEGEVFLSNAVVADKYCLRACIVNFRTAKKDIEEIIQIIVRKGRVLHEVLNKK
jgi:glutamate/tyrosine decarboxylase-like PLP-dependent enzyme